MTTAAELLRPWSLAAPVLRRRLPLNFDAASENIHPDDVAAEFFRLVPL